jgi:hypothetical protein
MSYFTTHAEYLARKQYITAEQARELGARKAEYFDDEDGNWFFCEKEADYLPVGHTERRYRAIKQAQQETYITAAQARELGAGAAEWNYNDTSNRWFLCTDQCVYPSYLKYRAIKQAQTEPVDHVKLLGETYGFLQSTCPECYADAAFHAVPEPIRAQAIAPYAEPSDQSGERVRHTQEAGRIEVDPHATLRAEYAKQVKDGTTGFYLWELMTTANPDVWQRKMTGEKPDWTATTQYRYIDISCMVSKDGEPAIRMLRTDAQELQAELGDTVEWSHATTDGRSYTGYATNNKSIRFSLATGTYTYRTIKLDGRMVTPTHSQIAEWREEFETTYLPEHLVQRGGVYIDRDIQHSWQGYLRARTEQATEVAELAGAEAEIAALKQGLHRADEKLAEVMPLANFGAMVADFQFDKDGCSEACIQDTADECGLFLNGSNEYAPNIEATIEKILKD